MFFGINSGAIELKKHPEYLKLLEVDSSLEPERTKNL